MSELDFIKDDVKQMTPWDVPAGTHPFDDLKALSAEIRNIPVELLDSVQQSVANIRSEYERLIETFEEAIQLIDTVRERLNRRKGEVSYGRGRRTGI